MYRARRNGKTYVFIHQSSKKPNTRRFRVNEKAVPICTGTAIFHLSMTY